MITDAHLKTLCDIAREAGAAIMELYNTDVAAREKSDRSPLTEADLRADHIIRTRLEATFPGIFILSEESASATEVKADDPFFLVDPLDGTKEFLNRNGEFTVNIAFIHDGLAAGVVFAPALDLLYFAARGKGAFRQQGLGEPTSISTAKLGDGRPLKVVGSRSHGSDALQSWLDCLGRPFELVSVGSSLKIGLVAEGSADVYPRFGLTSQWDTAAAQVVLECAGGALVDLEGAVLRYGCNRPMLNPFFIAFGDRDFRPAAQQAIANMTAPKLTA